MVAQRFDRDGWVIHELGEIYSISSDTLEHLRHFGDFTLILQKCLRHSRPSILMYIQPLTFHKRKEVEWSCDASFNVESRRLTPGFLSFRGGEGG